MLLQPFKKPVPRAILKWQEGRVVSLAQAVRDGDHQAVLILADALQDAGMASSDPIVTHLYEPFSHCKLCPAINRILKPDKRFKEVSVIVVDYDLSLQEAIAVSGLQIREDYEEDFTEENFPCQVNEQGKKEVAFPALFRPGTGVLTKRVLEQIKEQSCRPATLRELLAYGGSIPIPGWVMWLSALGSSFLDDGELQMARIQDQDNISTTDKYQYISVQDAFLVVVNN